MNLQEALKIVFPGAMPTDIADFFAGRPVGYKEQILEPLRGVAKQIYYQPSVQPRRETLNNYLGERRRELAELTRFAQGAFYSMSAEVVAVRLIAKDVAQRQIEQIEQELAELVEEERQHNLRGQAANNLVRLAECHLLAKVPSQDLADFFESTPEQLATPLAWERHLQKQRAVEARQQENARHVSELAARRTLNVAVPQETPDLPEAIEDDELWGVLSLALPQQDHRGLSDIFEHFRRREVGGQIAELIFSQLNRLSGRAPEREQACKRLLRFAVQINPPLAARYAV